MEGNLLSAKILAPLERCWAERSPATYLPTGCLSFPTPRERGGGEEEVLNDGWLVGGRKGGEGMVVVDAE